MASALAVQHAPRFYYDNKATKRPLQGCSMGLLLRHSRLLGRSPGSLEFNVLLSPAPVPEQVLVNCQKISPTPDDEQPSRVLDLRLAASAEAVEHMLQVCEDVGYYVILQDTSELLTVAYVLVLPTLLFSSARHAKFPTVIQKISKMRECVIGGACCSGRDYSAVPFQHPTSAMINHQDVYLSWPEGNAFASKQWVLHRISVPDEDTRGCSTALLISTWLSADPETSALVKFPGFWGYARPHPWLRWARYEDASQISTLSNGAVIAIWTVAAVWATVSLIVVVVLFVRLKKKS
jgi:hypothetical protein